MTGDYSVLQTQVQALHSEFGSDAYLLYTMGLRLRTLDHQALFADNVLDGPDDKKIDFLHIDYDAGIATVAQYYYSSDWSREAPPANKASDLNTAINWLLESNLDAIPRESIRTAAEQVRDALRQQEITRLEVFFIHNLPESANVEAELQTVARGARRSLETYAAAEAVPPECYVRQVGRSIAESWRKASHEAISIHETVHLDSAFPPQRLEMAEWKGAVATIPATALVDLRRQYGDRVSSANVRDFLGSRKTARNINRQISKTAQESPQNFWIFNNGITILTMGLEVEGLRLELNGFAIINGAQTTGSLVEAADEGDISNAHVLVRAIQCNDPSLIESVIRYNNTQNPIKAWELRVVDPVQKRLKENFETIGISYQLRRGLSRRKTSDVVYEALGPYLAAFYGDPIAAHKNKADLYENESKYRNLFDEHSNVRNLLLVYRLGNSVARAKADLKRRVDSSSASEDERIRYNFFRYGSFSFVVIYVCAEVIGLLLEAQQQDFRRRVTIKDELLLDEGEAEALLSRLADAVLGPIQMHLEGKDAYQELKTQEGVRALAQHTRTIFEQVDKMRPDAYSDFREELILMP